MGTEDVLCVQFSEDGSLGVEFSEDFLSSSLEEQIQSLEAFFWEKTLEPSSTQEVNREMTQHEITIILAQAMLAKLKRGERIDGDTHMDISLEELMVSDVFRTF
jgi:flagellar capping protein FliD